MNRLPLPSILLLLTGVQTASEVDPVWLSQVRGSIVAEEYHFTQVFGTETESSAPNRAQGVRSRVSGRGIEVFPGTRDQRTSDGAWNLRIETTALGRVGAARVRVSAAPGVIVAGARATLDRGVLEEWFINGESGIEHGWTIAEAPPGHGPLELDVALHGLRAEILDSRRSAKLVDHEGVLCLWYSGLAAFDADGRELDVSLQPARGGLRIRVELTGATFPVVVDPLITAPAWTVTGVQTFEFFGQSVSTAGDVNADGYSDVLVGAFGYEGGVNGKGRALLYLGSESGISTTPAWTADGGVAGAAFGKAVSTAGDVNGDGYHDVVIGASEFDLELGFVRIYLGSASGLQATPAVTMFGPSQDSEFGYSLAAVGDVNGDGFDDVLVGAKGSVDSVYLYLGSASGPSALADWSYSGGNNLGWSVGGLGDVNGDGVDDFAAGGNDVVVVFYGSDPGGPAGSPDLTLASPQSGAFFGYSVAGVGDFDGDGYADMVVGALHYDNGELNEGAVYFFPGGAAGLPASPTWSIEPDVENAIFGAAVGTAGDVNGDGLADLIVGAPVSLSSVESAAYVYFGSNLAPTGPDWSVTGETTSGLGGSVGTAGDFDGDGYSDVLIGEQGHALGGGGTAEGRALVYFGCAEGLADTPEWTAPLAQTESSGGVAGAVAGAGDVNGDGFGDVVIGDPLFGTARGRALLYLGSEEGLSLAPDWVVTGDQFLDLFGFHVDGAGDVDGDGYGDVIVAAPDGRAHVYQGGPGGLATSASWILTTASAPSIPWGQVAGAGDLNGDGYADVAVSSPSWNDGEGHVWVYYGSASGLPATADWDRSGGPGDTRFGQSVSTAGDVNRDGYAELIVGAPQWGASSEGAAYVFAGSFSGLGSSPSWTLLGQDEMLGWEVSDAGDVDGDGYGDVLVTTNLNLQSISSSLFRGSPTGLETTAAWNAGELVAHGAGDIDGDGFGDVIAGNLHFPGAPTDNGRAALYLGSSSGLSTSPAWSVTGAVPNFRQGGGVGSEDVDGDGFCDVLVMPHSATPGGGPVTVHHGNRGALPAALRQQTSGMVPLPLMGKSDSNGFRIALDLELGTAGGPAGRTELGVEYEVQPIFAAFDSEMRIAAAVGDAAPTTPVVGSFEALDLRRTVYKWRLRFTTDNPYFPHGPWLTLRGRAASEGKLRPDCSHGCPTLLCMGTACPCGNEDPDGGCRNSTGHGGKLVANVEPASITANNLGVFATDMPPGNLGIIFAADSVLPDAFIGDGRICIGGGTHRYMPVEVSEVGTLRIAPLTDAPLAPPGFFIAGETRYFQAWSRDVFCSPLPVPCPSPCGSGSNLSNGVAVFFVP